MNDEDKELSTIDTEHLFMKAGDPMVVNRFDVHELHIQKHKEKLLTLNRENDDILNQAYINMLEKHIQLHEDMQLSI